MGKKNFKSGKSSQKPIYYSSSQVWNFDSAPDLHPMMVKIMEMFNNCRTEINSSDGDRNPMFLNIKMLVIPRKILH